MHYILCAMLLALAALPGGAAAESNLSISIGQPGFYGRLDIGNLAPPPVIYPQPVIIQRGPVVVDHQPLYLRVPPGHAKHWHKHCHRYQACGRPVYFVQERWYQKVYVPHTHRHDRHRGRDHYDRRDDGHGHGKKHRYERDHYDRRDDGYGHGKKHRYERDHQQRRDNREGLGREHRHGHRPE